jgi:DNA-dependent RNA polymerase auxiliary subunit epsilon
MLNVLLDGFPKDYKGYKINTSYKVGILLTLLTEDETIDEDLKFMQAFNLLYIDTIDDFQVAYDGLMWFLSCGKSELHFDKEPNDDKNTDKCIDFDLDSMDIWAAFYVKGIDLSKVDLHWFAFTHLLGNMNDTILSQKMQFRSTDLSKMKGDTRKYYAELKEKYKIRKVLTKEEYEEKMRKLSENNGSYYMKLRELNKR